MQALNQYNYHLELANAEPGDDGIAAVIPAEQAKRIQNKNFIVIDGQPAVARIIDKLVSTNLFDKIIVSTDLKKFQVHSKNTKTIFI